MERRGPGRGPPKWVTIDGKRFGAAVFEIPVDADIDAVWAELADNYANVADLQAPITKSYVVGDAPASGPGAVRHCDINFKGKKVAIDERIIDWIDTPTHKEYTYDVYESKGFPAAIRLPRNRRGYYQPEGVGQALRRLTALSAGE